MKRLQALCLISALFLFSAIANAQMGHILHVATQYGETTFDTDIVDSIYFDENDSVHTSIPMESIKVFQEQQNIYPSDLFTQSLVMCHRGLAGFPENTYEALEAAIKVGYKMVECDIARSKDGVFVLQHDATIDRCSNGTGRVDSCYFAYLQQLDFGSWYNADFSYVRIAALEDIIKFCKRKNVILELDIADNDRFQDSYLKICSSWYRSTACCRAPYSAPRSHVWRPCKPSAAVCASLSQASQTSKLPMWPSS